MGSLSLADCVSRSGSIQELTAKWFEYTQIGASNSLRTTAHICGTPLSSFWEGVKVLSLNRDRGYSLPLYTTTGFYATETLCLGHVLRASSPWQLRKLLQQIKAARCDWQFQKKLLQNWRTTSMFHYIIRTWLVQLTLQTEGSCMFKSIDQFCRERIIYKW